MRLKIGMIVALCCTQTAADQLRIYQHGTVVRMRTADCALPHHGFMATFGGPQWAPPAELCPEYTLVSEKVVFVIVGNSSNQLIPLADVVDFRFRKNELAVRVDDARHETRFVIKEMILRPEWDQVQKHITDQLSAPAPPADDLLMMRTRE
jgi:hypothetical protein